MKYSLLIPIYNEASTIHELVGQLKSLRSDVEIIIIDDGSTDGSKSILNKYNFFKIIHNTTNSGKGYSIIAGAKVATTKNLILMDGDLEIDISCVEELINTFENNQNHVIIGTRWNNKNQSNKNINTYGNYFINFIFNILYKTKVDDILCCVKLINRNLFNNLNLTSNAFSIEAEIMSKLALKNIKFKEINVSYNRRGTYQGKKLKISDGWGILWKILSLRLLKK